MVRFATLGKYMPLGLQFCLLLMIAVLGLFVGWVLSPNMLSPPEKIACGCLGLAVAMVMTAAATLFLCKECPIQWCTAVAALFTLSMLGLDACTIGAMSARWPQVYEGDILVLIGSLPFMGIGILALHFLYKEDR